MKKEEPAANGRGKKVVFTCGGKGGTGKTTFMSSLVEWYLTKSCCIDLVDLDTENKMQGSLRHFHPTARKVDVASERGLDVFLDVLSSPVDVLLADMGAGQGAFAAQWFNTVYEDAAELGLLADFVAISVVTHDPASVESMLTWAAHLKLRVRHVVVKNAIRQDLGFDALDTTQAREFLDSFEPTIIELESRAGDLEVLLRQTGTTLSAVADCRTEDPALRTTALRVRAGGHRRRLYQQLNQLGHLLVPAK